ncbi:putative helicase senataxin-like [Dorcoceras hygrometricum]|uniref:Putative helicase senataxin-like n=1 Tax=Dorcoceras hygrometricum TaxID=472368 RepID=A0A2Z7AKU2_9LAMI|nr:putative helicase senataxin-like [Dorcoceras hygrometricum]
MLRRRDHLLVFAFVLPSPATNARSLPTGPPPGPGGSNGTDLTSNNGLTRENKPLQDRPPPGPYGSNENLGSNHWLTRENWSLQVDAPAMLRRRDHLLVFAFVLPSPATNEGDLPTGPLPGPYGSNVTDLTSNHGPIRENEPLQVDAPAQRRDAPLTTSTA